MLRLAALTLLLAVLLGCSSGGSLRPAGDSCLRSSECEPGLACVANRCTTDLGGLAEAGMVPMRDTGPPDGALLDAAMDTGMPPADTGPPPVDTGPPPPVDAGPPPPMDA